jgi:putative endonuclease
MRRDFQPAVYIVANRRNGTIYVGVTSNLMQRIWQHREGAVDGFTKRYGCKLLVWFELHSTMEHAITREKQLKAGSRRKKLALIEAANPQWRDLYAEICG